MTTGEKYKISNHIFKLTSQTYKTLLFLLNNRLNLFNFNWWKFINFDFQLFHFLLFLFFNLMILVLILIQILLLSFYIFNSLQFSFEIIFLLSFYILDIPQILDTVSNLYFNYATASICFFAKYSFLQSPTGTQAYPYNNPEKAHRN